MKKEEIKLKLEYSFRPSLKQNIIIELDYELKRVAKRFGFKFEGSGFDFKTRIRDLSFYKRSGVD